MATKIIQPLDPADFSPTADTANPGFADLFNSEVGDAASSVDGFDNIVTELAGLIDALDSGMQLLAGADGGTLDDTFADILTLDPEPVAQTLADVTAALPAIDAAANDLGTLIGATATPTPPAPAPKQPTYQCPKDTLWRRVLNDVLGQQQPQGYQEQMTNGLKTDFKVSSATLTQEPGGIFSISGFVPVTIKPNATVNLYVLSYNAKATGKFACSVELVSPNEPGPAAICYEVDVS